MRWPAAGIAAADLDAIGITNQRETAVIWDRASGRPLHPAIVWQDRRTADACRLLPAELLRERTGLVPDPYFSATKWRWLLDNAAGVGPGVALGTVDSWLVWRLTGGEAHVTDHTNASRTLLLLAGGRRLGRRAARAVWHRPRPAAPGGGIQRGGRGGRAVRRSGAGGRPGRRPAGGPVRPGLLRARGGQGHLRHRLLRAGAPGRRPGPGAARAAEDGRRPAAHVRAGGCGVRGRGRRSSGCATGWG